LEKVKSAFSEHKGAPRVHIHTQRYRRTRIRIRGGPLYSIIKY
jgi:hypothetical protein